MRLLPFILLFLFCRAAVGQDEVTLTASPQPSYDSVRSQYIKAYPEYFFIWPVLKQRKLDFELESVLSGGKTLAYKSNKPYSFGVGMYLFELGFELAFAVPLDEQSKLIYGESDARDIQLNILGKKWGIDAYHQKYNGFYIVDPDENMPANKPYRQRPDIETKNIGLTGNYTFNNKKFSFRSAYNFAERQLRSAGSFLLFGSLSSFKTQGDSALIGTSHVSDFGDDAADIMKIKATTLGLAPGYTYSLIYKGFFLNGTLAVGPAHNWLSYDVRGGASKNDINFSPFVNARLALGYNGDRFFGGLSFMNQGRTAKFDKLDLRSSNSSFKILFGYRFKEFGFLKKRIWDLPKSLFN